MDKKEQVMIDFNNLEPSPFNSFMDEDHDRIDDMVGNIKSLGLITPLSVIGPFDNGNYQILSGERRYQAIKKIRQEEEYANNYENVACYVVGTKDMDEYEQKLVIESANIETRDFDKNAHILNLVSLLIEMRDSGKISNEQIATEMDKYMSCSERYKRMYKTICARGTEETKEILKSGKIAVHEAAKIATMPEEAQKLAAEMINEAENGDVNYSKKDIMSAVNQAKAESKEIKKNLVNMSETGQINRALESYNANVENDMTDDFDTDDENEEVPCFFLDPDKGCTLSYEDKPFDCKIWPLRIMKKDDEYVIALTPTCPSIGKEPSDELQKLVDDGLGDIIYDYAKTHPFIIKDYKEGFPVLMVRK